MIIADSCFHIARKALDSLVTRVGPPAPKISGGIPPELGTLPLDRLAIFRFTVRENVVSMKIWVDY